MHSVLLSDIFPLLADLGLSFHLVYFLFSCAFFFLLSIFCMVFFFFLLQEGFIVRSLVVFSSIKERFRGLWRRGINSERFSA